VKFTLGYEQESTVYVDLRPGEVITDDKLAAAATYAQAKRVRAIEFWEGSTVFLNSFLVSDGKLTKVK
jgi:hypothetical protein